MTSTEWLLLLSLAGLWGGSFLFAKVAVSGLPPLTAGLGRVGLGAVALLAAVAVTGRALPRSWPVWRAFVVMGVLNNLIPICLILWSQTRITSGLASILNASTPLFTVVLAHVLTRDERATRHRLGGVLAGVVLMIGPDALAGLGLDVLAQLAVLGAAASYALAGLFGRRFRDPSPLVTATGQGTAASVLLLPVALVVDRPWTLTAPPLAVWGAVAGLALPATVVASVFYFRILATAGATNLLLVTFLIPVSALWLGAAFLDEPLVLRQLAGTGLIGAGLAAIDGRPLGWVARALPVFTPARSPGAPRG
jgi:drug/metabolite transporter (DMT)-like permease